VDGSDLQVAPTRADVGEVLFDAATIAAAVRRLARSIAADSESEAILLVGVLKGALFLTADLARALPAHLDVRIDFLSVASYGRSHRSSGDLRLLSDTSESVEGKHVVVVDGILDRGATLAFVERHLMARRPASLRSCVLLDKEGRAAVPRPEYIGLRAPDVFVVGYGLDYQEKHRHLPYLAKLPAWQLEG
jgi:hypoxanthine phosphoribosyltransferase